MADRFDGNIDIGGSLSQLQFDNVSALIEQVAAFDSDGSGGHWWFNDCQMRDFESVIAHCQSNKIPLAITLDAKYEYTGTVHYYIDGEHSSFNCDADGDVVVAVCEMLGHPDILVKDYVAKLGIPDFPNLCISDGSGVTEDNAA